MSSDEWDTYAYEQATKYYDSLLAMYDKDSAEYAVLIKEKEALTE
jgi:hypothetical protein